MNKFLSIVGVRPQFIKAATVCSAVERHNRNAPAEHKIQHELLNTGQHYDFVMADVFFQQLPLPTPDYNLSVGSGMHGAQTGAMLEKIEAVLMSSRPDTVIVYGDTNSTLAGALAATKLHIPVAHVESGLRSFNRHMPEEINRIVSDHVADVLLCPTRAAMRQLEKEGVTRNVYFSGDVMLDAVQDFMGLAETHSTVLSGLDLPRKQYVLITIHRAENTDSPARMRELVETLCHLEYPAVLAMHPRLRVKLESEPGYQRFRDKLKHAPDLKIIGPVSYLDMLQLERNAMLVMTDSGGVQKECYFVATPCLTLRDETEWTETLEEGWNRVVGTTPTRILPVVESLLSGNGATPQGQPGLSAFGNGRAADVILNILLQKEEQYMPNRNQPKTILVTGAAGFLGSHLCDALLSHGHRVIGVDDLSHGNRENLTEAFTYPGFSFHVLDITDVARLRAVSNDVEVFAHLAAFKIPRYGNRLQTLLVNSQGSLNVLEVAAERKAKFLFTSTSDVYGRNPAVPFSETSTSVIGPSTVPRWAYAASKLFDEHLAFAFHEKHGIDVTVLRIFGSYGPRQHLSWWGGPQSVFIEAILNHEIIPIHGDGLQTRSFTFVSDTVAGILAALESDAANNQIINIGSTHEITIADLARMIHSLCGGDEPWRLQFIPYHKINGQEYEDVVRRIPDVQKAKTCLGSRRKFRWKRV